MKPTRTRVWHRDAKFRHHWLGILTHFPDKGKWRVTFYSPTPTFGSLTVKRSHQVTSRKYYDTPSLRFAEGMGYVSFQCAP